MIWKDILMIIDWGKHRPSPDFPLATGEKFLQWLPAPEPETWGVPVDCGSGKKSGSGATS